MLLLAEDDDNDFVLLRRAFQKCQMENFVVRTKSGREAKEFLSNGDKAKQVGVIISDIKMPDMNGFELLTWFKGQPRLTKIPFFVLTSSDQQQDRQRCGVLGASGYLVKPIRFEALVEMAETFKRFLKPSMPSRRA